MGYTFGEIEVLGFLKRTGGRTPFALVNGYLMEIEFVGRGLGERSTRRIINGLCRREHIVLQGERSRLQTMALTEKPLPAGICRKCGCTELSACPEGCSWTDKTQTLCSECV